MTLSASLALVAMVPAAPIASATPSIGQLIGQKLMVSMSGTTPSASLLGRIERGEVGGVILFGSNIVSAVQVKTLAARLRQAAAAGGQPPLLISTDQEGGAVKRVPWAPPTLTVPSMGAAGSTATAFAQGKSTGRVLGCAGINSDLAPVADVPSSTSSFMYLQGRTWSFSASTTASMSDAFASGLEAGGDIPAMKHFPGIGRATLNTDSNVVTITASASTLAPGLTPYQKAIANGIPMIMLSNATYTAYDTSNGAGWSKAIVGTLLRTQLGFKGVTITDSLTGTASARGVTVNTLAVRAARAGTDMILVTGSESSTAATYASLVQRAQDATIPLSTLQASYSRILALKAGLATPSPDTTPPTVAAPTVRLIAGLQTAKGTAPVRASWSAQDPCGISQYSLKRRIPVTDWALQPLSSTLSTSLTQSLDLAVAHRYSARATDGAANVSAWAYGDWFTPRLTSESSSSVTYGGTWARVDNTFAEGGRLAYSSASGASATFSFTGSSVSWLAYRGPNRGSAAVYIDGVYRATINLYDPTYYARSVAYAASWSTNGTHTLRIVNLGTAGHSRIDLDGFFRLVLS